MQGATIIVDVFDHIEGQYAIIGRQTVWQALHQIRFDKTAIGAIEVIKHLPRHVESGKLVSCCLQRLQIDPPAAARLENGGGRAYVQLV